MRKLIFYSALLAFGLVLGLVFTFVNAHAATPSATATTNSEAGAVAANELTINSPAADFSSGRGFAIPGEIQFPGTPGYFGAATPGHRFIPLAKLLMYTTAWSADSAREMLKSRNNVGTGKKDVQIRDLLATKNTTPADIVYCSITPPDQATAGYVKQVSIGTVAATNKKSISADVLARAIVEASDRGANYIHFLAEGVNRELDASGFGIGFNATHASIYSSQNDNSTMGTGGMGYSRGWAGYQDHPWLQFTFLKVQNLPTATR